MLPSRVLLDTNVWLDAFDGARSRSAEASSLIERCVSRGIDLLYAVESVKDVFYLVSASLKRQARAESGRLTEAQANAIASYARSCVDTMCEVATAVGADVSDVWLARKYQRLHPDLEDCLVMAAAKRAEADLLVTSDDALLRHAPIAALSVADTLVLLGE